MSCDGGIDIVAKFREMLFAGTYLVQCKRYSGNVGKPPLRDLYGLVLSKGANKGILITNSFFTKQAKEFADGKNIELIDGNQLNALILKYMDNSVSVTNNHSEIHDFFDLPNFDKEKYNFLKKNVLSDKRNQSAYFELLEFLCSNIDYKNYSECYQGLILECKSLIIQINDRFKLKRTNILYARLSALFCSLNLLIGNLYEFYSCSQDGLNKGLNISDMRRNLLVVFKHFEFELGIKSLEKYFTANEFQSLRNGSDKRILIYSYFGTKVMESFLSITQVVLAWSKNIDVKEELYKIELKLR